MVNVIWTGDTLAIVWFWQVSNLKHTPFCVCVCLTRKETDSIWYAARAVLLRQTAALCMIELILTVSNQTTAKQTGSCFKKGYIQVVL